MLPDNDENFAATMAKIASEKEARGPMKKVLIDEDQAQYLFALLFPEITRENVKDKELAFLVFILAGVTSTFPEDIAPMFMSGPRDSDTPTPPFLVVLSLATQRQLCHGQIRTSPVTTRIVQNTLLIMR